MKNIYDLVADFYSKLNYSDTMEVRQSTLEKFFRSEMWKSVDESKIIEQWIALEILFSCMVEWECEDLFYLSPTDYQEIFFRYTDKTQLKPNATTLKKFFALIKPFFDFYVKSERSDEIDIYERTVKEAHDSFYIYGKFILPARRKTEDELYLQMEHESRVPQELAQDLDLSIEKLWQKMQAFFIQREYREDLARAFALYFGPVEKIGEHQLQIDKERGYITFWDFFIFDYHTLKNDQTPAFIYYNHQREHFNFSEEHIFRDLMTSELKTFYVESEKDETFCRDLITDEMLDLPFTDEELEVMKKMIFIGHLRNEGVMLVDRIIGFPASAKLRERMKQEIFRGFEIFKYQMPNAKLKDFFAREPAMIRHILRVLSMYAKLNVIPLRPFSKPIQKDNKKLPPALKKSAKQLVKIGSALGLSAYSLQLLSRLYSDFAFVIEIRDESVHYMLATLYLFYQINNLPKKMLNDLIFKSRIALDSMLELVNIATDKLKIELFDPRYCMEEGFIYMLFWENKK